MTRASQVVLRSEEALELITMPEWGSVCIHRPNVLLQGSDESTEGVVLFLAPYLRRPVAWKPSQAPFALPAKACGALVLQNVAALNREEQSELCRWLDDDNERTQLVSTTAQPLFPFVERGLFEEALYNRLSVVLLWVDSSGSEA